MGRRENFETAGSLSYHKNSYEHWKEKGQRGEQRKRSVMTGEGGVQAFAESSGRKEETVRGERGGSSIVRGGVRDLRARKLFGGEKNEAFGGGGRSTSLLKRRRGVCDSQERKKPRLILTERVRHGATAPLWEGGGEHAASQRKKTHAPQEARENNTYYGKGGRGFFLVGGGGGLWVCGGGGLGGGVGCWGWVYIDTLPERGGKPVPRIVEPHRGEGEKREIESKKLHSHFVDAEKTTRLYGGPNK